MVSKQSTTSIAATGSRSGYGQRWWILFVGFRITGDVDVETIGSQVFVTKAVHCHRCMARIFGTGQQFSLGTDTYALECEFESKLARMVELGMAR